MLSFIKMMFWFSFLLSLFHSIFPKCVSISFNFHMFLIVVHYTFNGFSRTLQYLYIGYTLNMVHSLFGLV